jgi:hypothetical protein
LTRAKKNPKLEKPIPELAHNLSVRLIASHGIVSAEIIAKLVYEKIVASRKSLERRYGK